MSHNLGSMNVLVQVQRQPDGEIIDAVVTVVDPNTITIGANLTGNLHVVVGVMGASSSNPSRHLEEVKLAAPGNAMIVHGLNDQWVSVSVYYKDGRQVPQSEYHVSLTDPSSLSIKFDKAGIYQVVVNK